MHYSGFYTSGYTSMNILRIGGLTIENQSFEEATYLKSAYLWEWDDLVDSVLGVGDKITGSLHYELQALSTR
jgi:hypothetical protein